MKPIISEEIRDKVAGCFGGKLLEANQFDADFIWVAELPRFRVRAADSRFQNPVIAVMNAVEWRKGILLIPTAIREDGQTYLGERELSPINLEEDPVADVLKRIDLTNPKRFDGIHEHSFAFDLTVITPLMTTDLHLWTGRFVKTKVLRDFGIPFVS